MPRPRGEHTRHPATTMRAYYIDLATRAIVDVDPPKNGRAYISRVNTPYEHRRQGIATRLLEQVFADADKENVAVYLICASSGQMTDRELQQWYKKRGFVQGSLYMTRHPSVREEVGAV